MPRLAGAVGLKQSTTSFVDARGKISTVRQADLPGTATEAMVTAFQNAIGDLSNAAIFKSTYGGSTESPITDVTALDEAESSVTTGANAVFQNSVTGATKTFRIPAIDMSDVDVSGNFLQNRADNAQVEAMAAAGETMLGANWHYTGASISTHARGGIQQPLRPIVAEPGVGVLPGDNPAV